MPNECRKHNRVSTAGKRVTETADQADENGKCNRAHTTGKTAVEIVRCLHYIILKFGGR